MTQLVLPPGCEVETVIRDGDGLVLVAHHRRDEDRCPSCGATSSSVHGRYVRRPSDLPCFGRPVRLRLRVRRFYCRDRRCRRRTFAERIPKLVSSRARRTRRLTKALTRIGLALGGEAGGRLLRDLGMDASGETILRLLHALPVPQQTDDPTGVPPVLWTVNR